MFRIKKKTRTAGEIEPWLRARTVELRAYERKRNYSRNVVG